MFILFNKNGIPVNVVNEETFEQLVSQKQIKSRYDWECYTPEQKYIIPWQTKEFTGKNLNTLEELQLMYIEYVYSLNRGNAAKTAKVLDMDRKTLYRYLKLIDNNKFLKKDSLQ